MGEDLRSARAELAAAPSVRWRERRVGAHSAGSGTKPAGGGPRLDGSGTRRAGALASAAKRVGAGAPPFGARLRGAKITPLLRVTP